MPHKMWAHNCKELRGGEIGLPVEICPDCGQRGEYDGWHYSVVEHMASYSQRTGLKPFGPHRALADKLLHGRMKKCPQCNGHGQIDVNDGEDCTTCPNCHGNAYIFDGTPEELEAIRQKIFQEFPDAKPGTPSIPREGETSGYTGGFFIKPDYSSRAGIENTAKSMMDALGIKGKEQNAMAKSKLDGKNKTSRTAKKRNSM